MEPKYTYSPATAEPTPHQETELSQPCNKEETKKSVSLLLRVASALQEQEASPRDEDLTVRKTEAVKCKANVPLFDETNGTNHIEN